MSFLVDVATQLKKLKQDKSSIRKFGLTMAIALSIIGAIIFFKGSQPENAYWFWLIAGLFLIIGLLMPAALRPIHKMWMGLAFVLGWFVSRLILSILYYLVITPISLVLKMSSKDLLQLKIDKNASSYWIKRQSEERGPEKYEKLF